MYQADWLLRFYGFELGEITSVTEDGNLDLQIDPKLAWALAHRGLFPIDVNRDSREMLLRVPGLRRENGQAASCRHAAIAGCATTTSRAWAHR